MRGFMMNAIYLSAIFAVVMTIVTVIFCMPILELMRTPENIIDGAYRYIVIIFWGIPVTYLYNLVSGIIRSMGDSRTPVVFLVIAAVINIGLDLFFYRSARNWSGRCSMGNGDLTADLRCGMPYLQYQTF